ncbi:MAG: uroporphyrinogen-III synthase [Bacteroidetes bacterium]|nr:uroporphyrinogen-III synthase [Bacteroidota bacterium]MCW5897130.1 uroporphyrinogen-III synthase [Bacteroidota bacterium]
MSLHGKTILITRQREQSGEFVAEIEKRGGRAVVIPMIHISDPESWKECDEALDHLSAYHAIVFPSANGVEGFFRRVEQLGIDPPTLANTDIFPVGEKTAEEIEKRGLRVYHIPDEFSADGLIEYFRQQQVDGKRFLLVRGNLGKDDLRQELVHMGAEVDAVEVYSTDPPGEPARQELKQCLGGGCDVVTFASPSAARHFSSVISAVDFSRVSQKTQIAVIGPTTRDVVERLGFHVGIEAKESTSKGLVEAIDEYYRNHNEQ